MKDTFASWGTISVGDIWKETNNSNKEEFCKVTKVTSTRVHMIGLKSKQEFSIDKQNAEMRLFL